MLELTHKHHYWLQANGFTPHYNTCDDIADSNISVFSNGAISFNNDYANSADNNEPVIDYTILVHPYDDCWKYSVSINGAAKDDDPDYEESVWIASHAGNFDCPILAAKDAMFCLKESLRKLLSALP